MTSAALAALGAALGANRSVRSLDLSSSKLGQGGPTVIRGMLAANAGLRELVLSFAGVGGGGGRAAAASAVQPP